MWTKIKFLNAKINKCIDQTDLVEGLQVNMALQADIARGLEEKQ